MTDLLSGATTIAVVALFLLICVGWILAPFAAKDQRVTVNVHVENNNWNEGERIGRTHTEHTEEDKYFTRTRF